MKINVIIADDHAIIREGLKILLEKKGIGVLELVENGRQAVASAVFHNPDIVMMDVSMPGQNGMVATARIKKSVPETKVIAFSMHSARHYIDKMFNSGASGYILKKCAFKEIYTAIQEVMKGNFYLSPSIARTYIESRMPNPVADGAAVSIHITPTEHEVLQLIAEGKRTSDIASMLYVSSKTIEAHRRNIMKKLNIYSVAGLTRYAIKEGIVSLD